VSVKKVTQWLSKKKNSVTSVTWFCCNALPNCRAPGEPMLLCSRLSAMSVYKNSDGNNNTKVVRIVLLGFVSEHWLDVVFLVSQCYCIPD
jgi:hypothetical protein